jgi:PAS domain S-box-containing protein
MTPSSFTDTSGGAAGPVVPSGSGRRPPFPTSERSDMSDSDTGGQMPSPAVIISASGAHTTQHPDPLALLVLDAVSGRAAASNPAGGRRLGGAQGARLSYWLSDLATAAGHGEAMTVRTWTEAGIPDGTGGDAQTAPARRVRVLSMPIAFRSRACLLVALRDGAPSPQDDAPSLRPGAVDGAPTADHGYAVLTLDTVGRIDWWGDAAQRLTGYRAEHVIGADTTLLHPAPARLAGDHHRALTHAYRSGDHTTEGWRLRSDGRLMWAEVSTAPLYDSMDRLLGFAQVIHDLTPTRRLLPRRADHTIDLRDVPVPRIPASAPAGHGPGDGSPDGQASRSARQAGRVPAQRTRRR